MSVQIGLDKWIQVDLFKTLECTSHGQEIDAKSLSKEEGFPDEERRALLPSQALFYSSCAQRTLQNLTEPNHKMFQFASQFASLALLSIRSTHVVQGIAEVHRGRQWSEKGSVTMVAISYSTDQ